MCFPFYKFCSLKPFDLNRIPNSRTDVLVPDVLFDFAYFIRIILLFTLVIDDVILIAQLITIIISLYV